ncbi:MAG: BatD family protein [Bacteroidota bacterium]
MRLKLLILTLFISVANIFAQDVEFNAVVTKKTIGKFEKFRIDFNINKKTGEITPPDFSDFAFLGGPSTSVSQSWVNGKSSYNKTYSYFLMPKNVGKFKIREAKIKVDGITYRTKPITITVVESNAKPKSSDSNDPSVLASENVHLKLELSSSNPYVNQQVTATYYLYFKMNINTPQILESPSFNGFWSQDYDRPQRYNVEKKYLNDELYQRITLKKTVLIPQKSGKLVIEPMTLDIPVEISTGKLDFFGNRMTRQYNYTTSTGKRTINVKALPAEGKPKSFTGAVGDYKFNVSASKTTVEANESITLKAIVKGSGNLKLFNIQKIDVPEELEAYDPKHNEKISLGPNGMTGRISEEYIIIPRYKGKYKIPVWEFSYFDPAKKKYISLKGEDFTIDVTKGKSPIGTAGDTSNSISKSDVQLLGKDIRYIHSKAVFSEIRTNSFFGSFLFYILLIIPFIAIPMIVFIYQQQKKSSADIVSSRRKKAGKIAKKMLSGANEALKTNDDAKFYEAVIQSMYKYLAYSLSLEQSELNKENIKSTLTDKGASEGKIEELMDLLSECEMARYAPSISGADKHDVYNKASELISDLEKI